ncbi:Hypothetical predicted protein [Prunus dulcis]|uniref:Uncharacterized protein n=1 Tax=Prunus dulcis TaxID=3755 RepID=A0A5E4EID1_PRUDU|nr:Hypothetical predicted protein [Prunus dulcis]
MTPWGNSGFDCIKQQHLQPNASSQGGALERQDLECHIPRPTATRESKEPELLFDMTILMRLRFFRSFEIEPFPDFKETDREG